MSEITKNVSGKKVREDAPDNIDKFGHCLCCHTNLLIWEVIDGLPQKRLKPTYQEKTVLLNDGSKMRIVICKKCDSEYNEDKFPTLIKGVFNGWRDEVETYSHWKQEDKDSYLKRYSKLKIVTKADGKEDNKLKKELKKYEKLNGKFK